MKQLVAAASVLAAIAVPAGAATFDLAYVGAGGEFESTGGTRIGSEGRWRPVIGGKMIDDGVLLRAKARARGEPAYAFIDGLFQGRPSGLGVCQTRGCRGEQDNVQKREVIILAFDQPVALTELTFRGPKHRLANGDIRINGDRQEIVAGKLAILPDGFLEKWRFKGLPKDRGGTPFYLSTATVAPIPLPAGAWLLSVGIAMLGWIGLRRREG